MTIEYGGLKLYDSDNDIYLECWGGSTKHPDIVFRYSTYQDPSRDTVITSKDRLFQFVMWCYSQLLIPTNPTVWVDFGVKAYKAFSPSQEAWVDTWFK